MNNELQISTSLGKHLPVKFKKVDRLADQCLSKIVLLQAQLSKEEKKLMQLLRQHGTKT